MPSLTKDQLIEELSRGASLWGQEVGDVDFTSHTFEHPVDLSGARFVGYANFSNAVFQQGANFSDSIFQEDADFRGCHFLPSYNGYPGALFDLSNFEKESHFQGCKCLGQFHFWEVRFHKKADFREIEIGNENSPKFDGQANFSWTWFNDKAIFTWAKFYWPAHFHRTLFNSDAMLDQCQFKEYTRFDGVKNKVHFPRFGLLNLEIIERLEKKNFFTPDEEMWRKHPRSGREMSLFCDFQNFKSTDDLAAKLDSFKDVDLHASDKGKIIEVWQAGARNMFPNCGTVSFQNTRFKNPQETKFVGVNMENVFFIESDIGSVEFEGVQWPTRAFNDIFPGRRSSVHDEDFAKSADKCHQIASIYSDLEKNYSASNNKAEARDFHYGQMQMLWKAKKSIGKYFSLSAFYKYVTGYGSRYQLPILWLLICLFLLFPTVYTLNSYTAQQGMAEQFGNAILRSLEVVTFRSDVVGYIEWLERFLIGGLLFLSGRAISSHIPSDG